MLRLKDYARIAQAVYAERRSDLRADLQACRLSRFRVVEWQAGSASNGFQGAILEDDDEVVCAFKGSGSGVTARDDWLENDVEIIVNSFPNQTRPAIQMVDAAYVIAGRRKPLSIVGHSLGGGLAQLVGYFGIPFVTFNAPGVVGNVPRRWRGHGRPVRGWNMILTTDVVGQFGRHIGETERFATPPVGGGILPHMMASVIRALEDRPMWGAKFLEDLDLGPGTWM